MNDDINDLNECIGEPVGNVRYCLTAGLVISVEILRAMIERNDEEERKALEESKPFGDIATQLKGVRFGFAGLLNKPQRTGKGERKRQSSEWRRNNMRGK